jgi:hypothetical protein
MKQTSQILSKSFVLLGLLLCGAIFFVATAYAAEEEKELPPREIMVAPEYPSVVVAEDEDVSVDMVVRNGGRQDEFIDLSITSVPKGWKAWFKTYNFKINSVFCGK